MTEGFSRVARSTRGGWTENVHFGVAAIVTPEGRLVAGLGDPNRPVFLRSAAKPVQLLHLLEAGGEEAFSLSQREIALMCSSHAGSDDHVAVVRALLDRVGLDEEALGCGAHPPLDAEAADKLRSEGCQPEPAHNNCSANHVGQLLACRLLELPLESYLELDHPLQRQVLSRIAEFAGLGEEAIETGTDGCGLPSFRLPAVNAAQVYARLADPSGPATASLAGHVSTVIDAMVAHPEMVAGTGRFTTELIRRTGGRVIGKEGADGFYGAAVRGPVALGVAIKIADGNEACRDAVVVEALRQAGCLSEAEFDALGPFQRKELLNHSGERIGELAADLELVDFDS